MLKLAPLLFLMTIGLVGCPDPSGPPAETDSGDLPETTPSDDSMPADSTSADSLLADSASETVDAQPEVSSGCTSDSQCDDHIACTYDFCGGGSCYSVVGPNTGTHACPVGQYCSLTLGGCQPSKACAKDTDCADSDPCHQNPVCDAASATCTWTILDHDGDGFPPKICGGGDCNDNDPTIYPGAPEVCDGKIQNCSNAVPDVNAPCPLPGIETCQAGVCACDAAHTCTDGFNRKSCTDFKTDSQNCGACNAYCPGTCAGGVCTCPSTFPTLCGTGSSGVCTDLNSDTNNCGSCGFYCGPDSKCQAGVCKCNFLIANCGGGVCADIQYDNKNCGKCGVACLSNQACNSGTCTCTLYPSHLMYCLGGQIDVACDPNNCGNCGIVCPAGMTCQGGYCM